jgi:tetratricopeptide (TPR) repeat protein
MLNKEMADRVDREPGWASSPLYEKAVSHFDAGEWEEAISLFSRLADEYPGDPELEQILARLRLKASFSREEGARGRIRIPRPGRRVLLVLGAVLLAVLLAEVSYAVYARWLVPAREVQEQATHLRELHTLARGYLAAGEYDRAADLYTEILSEAPDDAVAAEGLKRAEELQELETAYDTAVELTQQERWEEALLAWQSILAVDPNFRDVKYWTEVVEEQQEARSGFADAELRFTNEDWSGAIELLEQLRTQDPDYRREEVEALLVSSLVHRAEELLGQASDPAEVYEEVMELFDEAMEISPQDESVSTERAVAEAHSQGFALFQQDDWEGSVEELRFVYEHRPGYAGGQAVELLYQAYVRCGEERAEAGEVQGAVECYRAASELPVDDTSEASARYATLLPILTATPTSARPASTATPTPRPRPPTPTGTPSPYSFAYVGGSAQPLTRPGCPAPSIEGRVVDAAGRGLGGVWVRLEWWGNHQDKITEPDGKFGFAPLALENFGRAVPFLLTVIRSPGNPTPLSVTTRLDFPGCSASTGYHDGFTNVTFTAMR